MGRARGTFFLLALAAAAVSSCAWADLIHLKNGRILSGEVVAEDEQTITVRLEHGRITLRRSQVDHIERQTPAEYSLDLGRAAWRQGRYGPAVERYEAAVAADPHSEKAHDTLAGSYSSYGQRLLAAHRLKEAQEVYEKLLKLQPGAATAREALETLAADRRKAEEHLAAGRRLLEQGEIEDAGAAFEAAFALDAGLRALAAGDLALWRVRRGERLYEARRSRQAAAELEEAFGLDPALAAKFEKLYAAAILTVVLEETGAGQLEAARQALARARSFAPANRHVLYVAARLHEDLRELPAAAALYARALNIPVGSNSARWVAEQRSRLEKELGVEGERIRFEVSPVDVALYEHAQAGEFSTLDTAHFRIRHHNAELAQVVGDTLEAQRERILRETGLEAAWKIRPTVYLYRTQQEYTQITGEAAWTGGVSRTAHVAGRGLVRLEIHSWQTSPRLLKSVLPHELTHLIVNSQLEDFDSLPRAFHEGFAVFMEPPFRHLYYMRLLNTRRDTRDLIPLAELLTMKDYPRDPELFYAEGLALVKYLVQKRGLPEVAGLIRRAAGRGAGVHMQKNLLELADEPSLERLESSWNAWVREFPLADRSLER